MRISLFRLAGVLALLCATVVQAQVPAENPAALNVGDPAPALKVGKWIKGDPVAGFEQGKVYVVEFWATWCGPCRQSIPHLTKLQAQFPEVTIIGQDVMEEDPAKVEEFVKAMGDKMKYRVALDDTSSNKEGAMNEGWLKAANQDGIPTAFIVGKDGKIAWIGHPMDNMDKVVEQVLADKFDAAKVAQDAKKRDAMLIELRKMMSGNDIPATLKALDKAVQEIPGEALGFKMMKFKLLRRSDNIPAAQDVAKDLLETDAKDEPQTLNILAWALVDPNQPVESPDLSLAEKLSQRANALTENKVPALLDTLARVKFMQGDLDAAIQFQKDAIAKSEQDEEKAELTPALKKYEDAKKAKP